MHILMSVSWEVQTLGIQKKCIHWIFLHVTAQILIKFMANESVVFFSPSVNEKYLPDDEVVFHEFKYYKKRDPNFSR